MGYPHDVLVPAAQLLQYPVNGFAPLQLLSYVQPLPDAHHRILEDGSGLVVEGPATAPAYVLLVELQITAGS